MIERILPVAVTLLARTLRFKWSGERLPASAVVMFWHGKMLPGWFCVRKYKPIALVSASKDGNLLASVLSFWGYKLSRGSTKKGGMDALNTAMDKIRNGDASTLVITPDGPRGPRHRFKRGAFLAAKELSLPLYMLEIECRSKKVLKSWDKFEVPLPFSKVSIHIKQVDINHLTSDSREVQEAWLQKVSEDFD